MNSLVNDRRLLRVLFVEDSEADVELAILELRREQFEVKWERVEHESDLRESLRTREPEVVLSDYSMPRFNGIAALRVVREVAPHIPFIFMSGTIGEELAIESIRLGATDYILKGNLRRLSTAVRRALADSADRSRVRIAEEGRARLATILEATSDFVAISEPQGALIYTNAALRALAGLEGEDLSTRNVSTLYAPWAQELIERRGMPEAAGAGIWHGETALLALDGQEIPVSQVLIAHRDAEGNLNYFSAIARDIRERKAYEERIEYLANYDALTDLPNRTLLADRVAQATTYWRRGERTVALLVVDIDRFKLINDGFGQEIGDELLKLVGDRLRGIVRDGDTISRLGADGFAVLATDLARDDHVLFIAHKIHDCIRAPFIIEGRELHVTVSVGASICPRDGEDFAALLRNADAAMHRAKSGGQGGFQFYAADMTREAADRLDLESAMRLALIRDEFELHYQPQVESTTREIKGMEALARWKHPDRGTISPGVFIPIAENSDLIIQLGEWAVWTACWQIKEWQGTAPGLRVSVNISAKQFRSSAFPDMVARALTSTGIDPAQLELELTESVLVEEQSEVGSILGQLKKLGVLISIDDFGTGYSSLRYLSRLPFDCLKIDRSFVVRALGDKHDAAIIEAIATLAVSLGKRIIAEGVETMEQLAFLDGLGNFEIQGYLFSRPVPSPSASELLRLGHLSPGGSGAVALSTVSKGELG